MNTYHLKFNKESDGNWYIDFPNYPFSHHNLMMVAGADLLCEYAAKAEGHPDCAIVDVTTGEEYIDGRTPDIVMTRFRQGYGASYHNMAPSTGSAPTVRHGESDIPVEDAWLCPVTLLVLHSYPRQINIYLKNE